MVRKGAKYGVLAGGIGAAFIFIQVWLPSLVLCLLVVPVLSGGLAGLLVVRAHPTSEPRAGASLGAMAGAMAGVVIALSLFVVNVPSIIQMGLENRETLPRSWLIWLVVRAGSYLLSLTFEIIVCAGGGALAGFMMARPEAEPPPQEG